MEWKIVLQIVGACLGILYIVLEYKANVWLWVVGMIMPIIHGILYFKSGLYADFGMEVYYVMAGVWGLTKWKKSRGDVAGRDCRGDVAGRDCRGDVAGRDCRGDVAGRVSTTPKHLYVPILLAIIVLHGVLYFILVNFTDSTVPFFDAMTTALSIVAMWMLSRKYTEQWLVWLLTDLITVGLYSYKTLYVTAGLYMVYSIMAVIGYRKWVRGIIPEK